MTAILDMNSEKKKEKNKEYTLIHSSSPTKVMVIDPIGKGKGVP